MANIIIRKNGSKTTHIFFAGKISLSKFVRDNFYLLPFPGLSIPEILELLGNPSRPFFSVLLVGYVRTLFFPIEGKQMCHVIHIDELNMYWFKIKMDHPISHYMTDNDTLRDSIGQSIIVLNINIMFIETVSKQVIEQILGNVFSKFN